MRALLAVTLMACTTSSSPQLQGQEEWKTDFSRHTVPLEEIVSGGPPKDGIPALDEPRFVSVRAAGRWIGDREPVAVVVQGDEVKLYPHQILIWHEIVNDVVGGVPVSVTYCPLCNTTLAFDRRFDDLLLDFGTTGRLRNSDLVMYDRQSETWWQQATGEGIVGEHAGAQLTFIPAPVLSWQEARTTYPDAQVLSKETGYSRRYGDNPYVGYDTRRSPLPGFVSAAADDRLPAMERVVAIDLGDETVAIPFTNLRDDRAVRVEVGGEILWVLWQEGTASALDTDRLATGRDVGASAVFLGTVDGRELRLEHRDGGFEDRRSGTVFDLAGHGSGGALDGRKLEPVSHGNHFWFAWIAFKPDTRIVR